jgi:hypothetical protein
MGGYGSGRHGNKRAVEDLLMVDIRRWQRECELNSKNSFSWQWTFRGGKKSSIDIQVIDKAEIRFDYRTKSNEGEWEVKNYPVYLEWTQCNYGGERVWFKCPSCYKRVAKLYGGTLFLCRQCQRLAYTSQRETILDRTTRRVDKVRKKLEWEAGCLNGEGGKPKRMRWTTYFKLYEQHNKHMRNVLGAYRKRFGFDLDC